MGIQIREILSLEYFKDFHVIAGKQGLNKEIQGITVLDAPDGFCWTQGKELIFSSGYTIKHDPDCIYRAFQEGSMQKTSCMMVKRERYIDKIPQEMLDLFDKYEVPFITMPFSVSWMEVMNQINIAVLNRAIRRFRINGEGALQLANLSYKEQKIKRILQAVEAEMQFPAFLYDIAEEKGYYSSANFRRIANSFELEEEDFWNPRKPFTKHTLCDYIEMVRYRLVEQGRENQPRVSWIKIPLIVNGRNQAYFIVMESREFLDYYDEYSIRIAFILLQSVYEQMVVAQMTGDIGFENFIHFVVNSEESEIGNAIYRANVQGIYFLEQYIYIMFRQTNEAVSSKVQRRILERLFRKCFVSADNRLAFLDENEGMLFLDAEQWKKSGKEELRDYLIKFQRLICEQFPEMKMEFAILNTPTSINELKYNIEKCKRVLDMGEIICPKQNIWDYETLGPLVWLQIPEKELQDMLVGYKALLKDEKNVELLLTLKIYLENNMNFSVTAEKMYVHINTIRKRIEKINDFLNLDFTDPIVRLKTELLLQYMNLE